MGFTVSHRVLFFSAKSRDGMGGKRYFAVLTHEAGGVALVDTSLAVNLDEALHEDGGHLLVGERVLQAVAQEHRERHALAELVRTYGCVWAGRPIPVNLQAR